MAPCGFIAFLYALKSKRRRLIIWRTQSESNGMAESFVKTMKRDYISVMPRPDARRAVQNLAMALEHYNEWHPHNASATGISETPAGLNKSVDESGVTGANPAIPSAAHTFLYSVTAEILFVSIAFIRMSPPDSSVPCPEVYGTGSNG